MSRCEAGGIRLSIFEWIALRPWRVWALVTGVLTIAVLFVAAMWFVEETHGPWGQPETWCMGVVMPEDAELSVPGTDRVDEEIASGERSAGLLHSMALQDAPLPQNTARQQRRGGRVAWAERVTASVFTLPQPSAKAFDPDWRSGQPVHAPVEFTPPGWPSWLPYAQLRRDDGRLSCVRVQHPAQPTDPLHLQAVASGAMVSIVDVRSIHPVPMVRVAAAIGTSAGVMVLAMTLPRHVRWRRRLRGERCLDCGHAFPPSRTDAAGIDAFARERRCAECGIDDDALRTALRLGADRARFGQPTCAAFLIGMLVWCIIGAVGAASGKWGVVRGEAQGTALDQTLLWWNVNKPVDVHAAGWPVTALEWSRFREQSPWAGASYGWPEGAAMSVTPARTFSSGRDDLGVLTVHPRRVSLRPKFMPGRTIDIPLELAAINVLTIALIGASAVPIIARCRRAACSRRPRAHHVPG